MLMQWGQFLDHDIASSSQARGFNGSVPRCCADGGRGFVDSEFLHPECMPIIVPFDDPFYGPLGIRCLEFVRSGAAPHAGCELGWREQLNQVSAYIDASPIYSSSARQSDKLRLFRNGFLQYGRVQARRPLLPKEEEEEEALCRGGAVDASCFKAGDGRVNEHPGLVAMHIVWLRRHNRLATELSHINPHWSDEKVYQETRKIVGAMVQHITYKEFLPIVLGTEVMRLFDLETQKKGYYEHYSSKVNPNPASSFATAAFRFGHSLVQDSFMRYDRFHRPLANNVSLHEELSNPSNIWSFGAVDRLLLGLCNQPAQKRDEIITPELTNHLFQTSKFPFGMDLASINIQRGRDHGLPPYIEWREPCGLTPIENWSDLLGIMPSSAVIKMEEVYRDIDDIDLFTGGMAERPVIGGLVGPTFACIIAQQFSNLRRGDRFWYENGRFESSFTPAQLQQIRRVTLAHILCQTMENVDTLQPFVFLASDDFRNERISCDSNIFNNFELSPWREKGFDFDNNINDFDKTNEHKTPPRQPQFPLQFSDNIPSETITHTNTEKRPMTDSKHTISAPSLTLDDKLDIPRQDTSTSSFLDTVKTTQPTVTQQSTTTRQTTETNIKLDDKLDFSSKDIQQETKSTFQSSGHLENLPRSFINNEGQTFVDSRSRNSSLLYKNLNDTTGSQSTNVTNQNKNINNGTESDEPSLKTYGWLNEASQIPFLANLFSTTTKKPIRKPYRPHYPQIVNQQDYTTTETPNGLTYLINIVPKTTTSKYPYNLSQKETIKITIQADQPIFSKPQTNSFPYNKRPVYNNNKLEYRPVSDSSQTAYSSIHNSDDLNYQRPQNRPVQTNTQGVSFYSKPFSSSYGSMHDSVHTQFSNSQYGTRPNNRPYRPYKPTNNDYTTEYNPYSLVTFSHIETTKRYDLFNRPGSQYDIYDNQDYHTTSTDYKPHRPSVVSADGTYGINVRPSRPKPVKPVTGITIYIDNKPTQPKPTQDHHTYNNNNGYVTSNVQNTNDDDNVPLFTRPNYQKPFYNKPLTNSRPLLPKPFHNYRPNDDDEQMYSGGPSWNYRPDKNKYPNSNYNENYSIHKESDSPLQLSAKPNQDTPTRIGTSPSITNQQHNDLSIVIDPNLRQPGKLKNTNTPNSDSKKPMKFYYIGNILHKYTESDVPDHLESKTADIVKSKEQNQILKENYNNAWKPDENEHKLFYGSYDENDYTEPYEGITGNLKVNSSDNSNSDEHTEKQSIEQREDGTLLEKSDLEHAFSERRESSVKVPPKSDNKNQVFFEIIPSENSATRWAIYNEKPEENYLHSHSLMPAIDSDPQAIMELPHPMNFTAITKHFKRKKS